MSLRAFGCSGVLLGALMLYGCGGPGYVGVGFGPPPPPYAVGPVGYAPGPGYVWTDGYWDRAGGNWAWRQGRWMRPPHGYHHWESPRWERHGNGWRHHQGRWRR